MPKINEMLLKYEGLSMLCHLIQTCDTIIFDLVITQLNYVQSLSLGEIFLQKSTNGNC